MTSGDRSPRAPRLFVVWYRCAADNLDHAVTDEAFARGAHQEGRYLALCGHEVLIDSCLMPPGCPCPACRSLIRLREPEPKPRRHRKRSRRRRLLGRLQTPAVPRLPFFPRDGRTPTSVGMDHTPTTPVPTDSYFPRTA